MGISATELREYVVRPTLEKLGVWTPAMETLLLGTAAQASEIGSHVKSEKGFGIFAIDSDTHKNVWDKFLAFDADRASFIRGLASQREFLKAPDFELVTNLAYTTAIAWGVYASQDAELPQDDSDLNAIAETWYQLYPGNTESKSKADFIESYRKLVSEGPKLVA